MAEQVGWFQVVIGHQHHRLGGLASKRLQLLRRNPRKQIDFDDLIEEQNSRIVAHVLELLLAELLAGLSEVVGVEGLNVSDVLVVWEQVVWPDGAERGALFLQLFEHLLVLLHQASDLFRLFGEVIQLGFVIDLLGSEISEQFEDVLSVLGDYVIREGLDVRVDCEVLEPAKDHLHAFFEDREGNRLVAEIGLGGGLGWERRPTLFEFVLSEIAMLRAIGLIAVVVGVVVVELLDESDRLFVGCVYFVFIEAPGEVIAIGEDGVVGDAWDGDIVGPSLVVDELQLGREIPGILAGERHLDAQLGFGHAQVLAVNVVHLEIELIHLRQVLRDAVVQIQILIPIVQYPEDAFASDPHWNHWHYHFASVEQQLRKHSLSSQIHLQVGPTPLPFDVHRHLQNVILSPDWVERSLQGQRLSAVDLPSNRLDVEHLLVSLLLEHRLVDFPVDRLVVRVADLDVQTVGHCLVCRLDDLLLEVDVLRVNQEFRFQADSRDDASQHWQLADPQQSQWKLKAVGFHILRSEAQFEFVPLVRLCDDLVVPTGLMLLLSLRPIIRTLLGQLIQAFIQLFLHWLFLVIIIIPLGVLFLFLHLLPVLVNAFHDFAFLLLLVASFQVLDLQAVEILVVVFLLPQIQHQSG